MRVSPTSTNVTEATSSLSTEGDNLISSRKILSGRVETRRAVVKTNWKNKKQHTHVRYNVQVNEQITALQLAESYLRQLESQILQLCQSISVDKTQLLATQYIANINQLIKYRLQVSAGTIDRQFNVSLDLRPSIEFSFYNMEPFLRKEDNETVIFSLAGGLRSVAALLIHTTMSLPQLVVKLNQTLGKWGIHATINEHGNVMFNVYEVMWPRVSTQLSIRGEGLRFAEQFYPIKLIAELSNSDRLQELIDNPQSLRLHLKELTFILDIVARQRQNLQSNKDQLRTQINLMFSANSDFIRNNESVLSYSYQLSKKLFKANKDYLILRQAIAGQANIPANVVNNTLS